jgi:acetyl esterase/lipase
MRARAFVVVVAMAVVAAGCGYNTLVPPGAAPLRYRDPVFGAVTITKDITYGTAPDQLGTPEVLKLDLYQPTGDTVTARPAVVWVHGGSFIGGGKSSSELAFEATAFAKQGYVTVSINYRLYTGACVAARGAGTCLVQAIVDAQHDAQAAVRFLRSRAGTYHVDPNRIAIGGTSAGAITALNVGANSEDPGTSGNPGFSSKVLAAQSYSGAKLGGAPQAAGDAASLLFHGTADPLVPYSQALKTYNDAKAAGLITYLVTYPGEGHVPFNHFTEVVTQTTNFFYWMLDLQHAAH